MTLAILSLLGALIPFGVWLWKRHAARQDSPLEQNRKAYHAADQETKKPSVALSDSLDELDRRERLRDSADRKQ